MTRSQSSIERALSELRRELRPLGRRRRRRVLEELQDHVLSAVEAGADEADAVRRLGRPQLILEGYPARRRTHRAALVAVPVAFLALAAPIGGTLVDHLRAGPTTSQAATISPARQQRLAQEGCVRAWNSAGNGHWHALARGTGAAQAFVSIAYQPLKRQSDLSKPLVVSGCGVKFMLARVASPYQRGVWFDARKVGDTFRFSRTVHVRGRSAAPAENATVDSAGRLTLSARALPPICPLGTRGSRVLSVVAGPVKTVLVPDGITSLGSSTRSFVVAIRNTGTIAIDGAIASLEVYQPAKPRNPTWRSKPVTIRRLGAGQFIEVPFTTPELGDGAHLVRATTAAIACEARFSDNSPVFRVRAS